MTSEALASDDDNADPVQVGDLIAGEFLTEDVLGRGGSGVVYSARRKTNGERVALKVIFAEHCHSRQIFGRYKREAAILQRIGGEHIVRFFDFVEHDGLLAIALERVEGTSLERVLGSPIELQRAVSLSLQICRGLEAAHEAGVIHRDLKPANVIVEAFTVGERARILDFGLAKVVHGEHLVTGLTERDMIFGTPEYMAPEQARGDEVDARCDVYALGVILYEMVTGSVPFKGRSPLATMTAQLTEDIEPPRSRAPTRDIPPALEAVILRALNKEADGRYQTAKELGDALEAALERRVISVNFHDAEDAAVSDTELALRRSQVHAAKGLLEDAEKLAASKAAKSVKPAPTSSRDGGRAWFWPVVTVAAILACVGIGVLLGLRGF
ncbi:MAG: serine/threonine protein kinase [Polyangiaceae bacterium]|nr:serine/threonine protein kinase [Polyangiaceae bacterium]